MLFSITAALLFVSATRADRPRANSLGSYPQEAELESLQQTCYRNGEDELLIAASKLNAQSLCRPLLKDAATTEPARPLKSEPWTHEPSCLHKSNLTDICIYTSSNFAGGRGISIVT